MTGTHSFANSKSPDLVQSPYEWCFRHCTVQAAEWADSSATPGMIDYVLDSGCSVRGYVYERFQMSKECRDLREKYRLGSLQFGDSETVPALQCADLLAYEMYKEADRTISNAPRPPRGSFLALFRNETDRLGTIKEEALKHEVRRGMQIHAATLDHLPSKEKFQVMCYALRRMKPENRETLSG